MRKTIPDHSSQIALVPAAIRLLFFKALLLQGTPESLFLAKIVCFHIIIDMKADDIKCHLSV